MGVVVATGRGAMLVSEPAPEYHHTKPVASAGAFAVVELFTSQGCSSCPAADRLLNDIIEEAKDNDSPVYGLSFHVSYWNYLGWKDPYSRSEFNVRQGQYMKALNTGTAYTPQMVVNGQTEFVGSSTAQAHRAIEAALSQEATFSVEVSAMEEGRQIVVSYRLDKPVVNSLINVALVQEEAKNYVDRGENSGRTLRHRNVVVDFKALPADTAGRVDVSHPEEAKRTDLAVVVFLQDKSNLRIVGASRVKI